MDATLTKQTSININGIDISWNLEKGGVEFLGISSTIFWNDPSLLNMFKPLVEEIGIEMFCLQIAYSSSLGTKEDYNMMVTQLGNSFEEGFLNWGKAVGAAGWGTFEILYIDYETSKAKVVVHNPWELHMQKNLVESELWGCPFIQGKIIGIFNNAFNNICWADAKYFFHEDEIKVEFDIYPYELTIEEEIERLRTKIEKEKILHLKQTIEEKVKERDELLKREATQALINEKLEQRVKEEIEKNRLQEERLQAQSRMAQMGEMISMIAHQWRQPLGAISSTSIDLQMQIELQSFDLEKKEDRAEFVNYFLQALENINSYVLNLTNTIDDFRNFYKPNKQTVTIKLEDVVSKSLAIMTSSLLADNVKIEKEYNSKDKVEIYDNEMMQVILNILKNAQDNLKEHEIKDPYIKIIIEDKKISISNNGGTIPEDVIRKIFDPYFSTKNEKNGTGLGLYMSKIIVEEHHKGVLSVVNIDAGVCFTIELDAV